MFNGVQTALHILFNWQLISLQSAVDLAGVFYLLVAVEQLLADKVADLGESGKKQVKFGQFSTVKFLGTAACHWFLGME